MREVWLLIDGGETYDARFITIDEAERLNRQAQIATDGNLMWVRQSTADARHQEGRAA